MTAAARRSYSNGGTIPFGYRSVEADTIGRTTKRKLAIDAVEADIVRTVFQLALTGTGSSGPMGVRNIAQQLNAAGHRTRAGGEFYSSTIHEMLIREAYAGTRSWNVFDKNGNQNPDDQIIDYEVPAILDRETFDAVQSRLGERQPRQRGPRLDSAPSLFGGLIRCGCCGGAMSPSTGTGRKGVVYRYYKCASSINKGSNACDLKPISRDVAEQRVMAELINWLVVPGRLAEILAALHARKASRQGSVHQRIVNLQRDAAETEKSLANLYRAIEGGILDPAEPTLQDRVQELSAKRDLARTALERAPGPSRRGAGQRRHRHRGVCQAARRSTHRRPDRGPQGLAQRHSRRHHRRARIHTAGRQKRQLRENPAKPRRWARRGSQF